MDGYKSIRIYSYVHLQDEGNQTWTQNIAGGNKLESYDLEDWELDVIVTLT
jgi:hypothetical protein